LSNLPYNVEIITQLHPANEVGHFYTIPQAGIQCFRFIVTQNKNIRFTAKQIDPIDSLQRGEIVLMLSMWVSAEPGGISKFESDPYNRLWIPYTDTQITIAKTTGPNPNNYPVLPIKQSHYLCVQNHTNREVKYELNYELVVP
jgi:hypothetical protein